MEFEYLLLGTLLTPDLLKALNNAYPPRPPDPRDTEREIWMKAGERRLVEALHARFEETQEHQENEHLHHQ